MPPRPTLATAAPGQARAIDAWFPVQELVPVATMESWRKEVHRPNYHAHKWWATRLGSVFRTILLATLAPEGAVDWEQFYRPVVFEGRPVILDPFMGSGTTLGEALKLGCRAIGCDINPISTFQVRKALETVDTRSLRGAYERLAGRVRERIAQSYVTTSALTGGQVTALYTFWVMTAACPACASTNRLFDSYIFARHAYARRYPSVQILCPACGEVFDGKYGEEETACTTCGVRLSPRRGPASGSRVTCTSCGRSSTIIDAIARGRGRPEYEMYATLVLEPDGGKRYQRSTPEDTALFQALARELEAAPGLLPGPELALTPGHNTQQLLRYGVGAWRDIFNARQLRNLGVLLEGILKEPDTDLREYLLLLFSGALEFNNMLCSYKGEGTGAVRHAFSHHILRPHRTPLEAQVWGTPASSGSFASLFESRLLRAKLYAARPFEVRVGHARARGVKVPLPGARASGRVSPSFDQFRSGCCDALVLNGDSSELPLPNHSVDAVVTDPPYFDMVNYSELADLFYAWLGPILTKHGAPGRSVTTRHEREVQSQDPERFARLLGDVFKECARVLRPGAPLVFTFHHSNLEAWLAVVSALRSADMRARAVHSIKAEMSVAAPKRHTKSPIDVDCVISSSQGAHLRSRPDTQDAVVDRSRNEINRLNRAGAYLSVTDVKVILAGQALRLLTASSPPPDPRQCLADLWACADSLWHRQAGYQGVDKRTSVLIG